MLERSLFLSPPRLPCCMQQRNTNGSYMWSVRSPTTLQQTVVVVVSYSYNSSSGSVEPSYYVYVASSFTSSSSAITRLSMSHTLTADVVRSRGACSTHRPGGRLALVMCLTVVTAMATVSITQQLLLLHQYEAIAKKIMRELFFALHLNLNFFFGWLR